MSSSYWSIILLVVMILVMYMLLIRPQKKREKETKAMRSSVGVGDEIITIGGICGKIVKTKEESLVIQVGADKVKFEIMRWAVSKVVAGSGSGYTVAKVEEPVEEPKKAAPKRMSKPEEKATEIEEDSAEDNK